MNHPSRCFYYENNVYTVINPSPVESLPGLGIIDPQQSLTCRDMRKALWALSEAPEMAYMLKRFTVESAFLSRLDCDKTNIPIVRTPKGYALREDIRASWKRLEDMFVPITHILMNTQHGNPEARVSSSTHWSLPRDCGYLQAHRSGQAARTAAGRSRDACVLLLARCTMAIALCDRSNNPLPPWVHALQGKVPGAWIDVLQESVVADLSPGLRAGAFIDLSGGTSWVHHVPCMIRANLPVYICWNESVSKVIASYPFLAPYIPPRTGIPKVVEEHPTRLFFRWQVPEPSSNQPGPSHTFSKPHLSIKTATISS